MEKAAAGIRYIPRHQAHRSVAEVLGRTALVVSAVAVAPLILFAALWASFLLWIGAAWIGTQLGF